MSPRSIVNGNLLRRFINQRVNIMVNIEDIESNGSVLKGKTTDDQTIYITLSEPVTSPINGWVEIIGAPTESSRVNCDEVSILNYLSLFRSGNVIYFSSKRTVLWLM